MPYSSINDLPEQVANVLPEHAKTIFKEAFNNAYNEYESPNKRGSDESREETAFKVAWSAVKKKYEKGADNKWHEKKS